VNDDLRLKQFLTYIRREAGLKGATWGLVAGLVTAAILGTCARVWPILLTRDLGLLSLLLPALAALIAFLIAYFAPRTPMEVARQSDTRMRLAERLATALAVEQGQIHPPPDLAAQQRADAQSAAARADPAQAFPLRSPRRLLWTSAALAALIVANLLVFNPQEARIEARRNEQEAIQEQVERLEDLRVEIETNEALTEETRETLLKELDDTIADLQEGDLSREEALARLAEAEERLQALQDDTVTAQAAELEAAGQAALEEMSTEELGQALTEGDYAAAAEALAEIGDQIAGMSAEERAAVAERLERMADAVQGTNPELAEALRQAAEATRQGDAQAAQQALAQAAAATEQAGEAIGEGQAVDQALAQIQEGKSEIAQSGTQGGQTPGSQGSGTGSGSGSGDGEGSGGEGGIQDPGSGPSSNAPGEAGETPYEPIYAPERLGEGEGEMVVVPGEGEGEGGPTTEGDGTSTERGEAMVPYDEVYAEYQEQAVTSLENNYIPPNVKSYVRAYFDAVAPEGAQ
jgi:organic radical activating enzyme